MMLPTFKMWRLWAIYLVSMQVAAKKPNIVLFITDDQSMNTLAHRHFAPHIYEHLIDKGTFYENFFAPISVCCPSRVSLLRAQLPHTHNVTFVSAPWGGYDRYHELGYNGHALFDFLQRAGYNTNYLGKLMNEHTVHNCQSKPVSGLNSSDFFLDPHTYDYWNPAFSHNNGPAEKHPGAYSTDLLKYAALTRLDQALSKPDPFFLGIAPNAPHSWIAEVPKLDDPAGGLPAIQMDIPAAHWRHARLFPTEQLDRVPSWNQPGGVSWLKDTPAFNATVEAYLDEFHRGRLRALQAVDELVDEVVRKVEAAGELDHTYFFYTSDNGYAIGTHRRQPGKTLNLEEDIHVPLLVRGPGIKAGHRNSRDSHNMVDLSATILDLAGAKADYEIDGESIFTKEARLAPNSHNVVEYWVFAGDEGVYGNHFHGNSTYRSLRIHEEAAEGNTTLVYSVWCTGERELYDLVDDPYQLKNLLKPLNEHAPFARFDATSKDKSVVPDHLQKLATRLDAILLVLKTCKGQACLRPYQSLFPDFYAAGGEVATFKQTLAPRFDDYFEGLPRVSYSECALGYQSRLERPIWDDAWAYSGFSDVLFVQQR